MKRQSDGRYRIKVTIGHTAAGIPVVKYASGRTKKEAEAAAAEIRRRCIGGEVVRRDVLASEWILDYYTTYRKPTLKETTARDMEALITRYILPYMAGRQLKSVTMNDLQTILNRLDGKGKTLVGNVYSIITGAFRLAAASRTVDYDPSAALKKPQRTKAKRRPLTDTERSAVLDMISSQHRDRVLLALLYYTGMRLGEVVGLQWHDVNFSDRVIHVRRDVDYRLNRADTVKTKTSLRTVPMAPELIALLEPIRGAGQAYVVTAATSDSFLPQATYKRHWAAIQERLGADGLTAHCFRHNYATLLYTAGVDVLTAQKILGHADPQTTLRIYTELEASKKAEGYDKAREIFAKVAEKLPDATRSAPRSENM